MQSWKGASASDKLTLSRIGLLSRLRTYENRQRECLPGYVETSSLRKLGRPRGPPASTNGFHPQAVSGRGPDLKRNSAAHPSSVLIVGLKPTMITDLVKNVVLALR